ncbi:hypothetical protein [Brumimicrobium oceani]|uniref:Uncharacterized protein n=1 Tax=Brumimicrobium oceani TaxID=2100725 RepID=A0A2U2X398_9FLAO|nr:hypothetical protein [Brumimicrobium oceani]PWH82240.1 hypothetical protein DIT68_14140 [Brumimicrobium oceani]
MKYKLVKIDKLSGEKASIYSAIPENESGNFEESFFDSFIKENKTSLLSEIKTLVLRLKIIGNETGARESYFKTKEGAPGDGVCALYDTPDKKLRLYCIRYGTELIIIGSGGPKNVRALQDDEKLEKENYILRWLSSKIKESMQHGELSFSSDYMDFEGNLIIEDYED